jgi:hypothetical protein
LLELDSTKISEEDKKNLTELSTYIKQLSDMLYEYFDFMALTAYSCGSGDLAKSIMIVSRNEVHFHGNMSLVEI